MTAAARRRTAHPNSLGCRPAGYPPPLQSAGGGGRKRKRQGRPRKVGSSPSSIWITHEDQATRPLFAKAYRTTDPWQQLRPPDSSSIRGVYARRVRRPQRTRCCTLSNLFPPRVTMTAQGWRALAAPRGTLSPVTRATRFVSDATPLLGLRPPSGSMRMALTCTSWRAPWPTHRSPFCPRRSWASMFSCWL